MTVLDKWDLRLDVDAVLRGQGAVPAVIRSRSPHLVESAGRALEEGNLLLQPRVQARRLLVEDLHHERLKLEGDGKLSGELLAQHMGDAQEVVIVLCTVGEALERRAAGCPGNLQHRSGQSIHQPALYGKASGGWCPGQHGWPRPRDGQHLHGTALAQRQIRGGLSA